MAAKLRKEEFVPFALERKGTVRINHQSDSCSGESKSLAITTKEDGAILATCFRCGASGIHGGLRHYKSSESLKAASEEPVSPDGIYQLPPDVSEDYPKEVTEWLAKAGVLPDQAARWGFLWSDDEQTLFMPVEQQGLSSLGTVAAGWVLRGFNPKSYRTLTHARSGFWGLYRKRGAAPLQAPLPDELLGTLPELLEASQKGRKPVCLVEDGISARKVAQAGMDCVALLTTSLKQEALRFILSEGYTEAYVWLDADNAQVRSSARRVARQLPLRSVQVVETGTDPKHESIQKIKELLKLP